MRFGTKEVGGNVDMEGFKGGEIQGRVQNLARMGRHQSLIDNLDGHHEIWWVRGAKFGGWAGYIAGRRMHDG